MNMISMIELDGEETCHKITNLPPGRQEHKITPKLTIEIFVGFCDLEIWWHKSLF